MTLFFNRIYTTSRRQMSVLHNFKIEKIYGERVKRGHKEYHIKWVGYGDDEDTWEPETDLIHDGHQKDLDAYKKAKKIKKKKAKKTSLRLEVVGTKNIEEQIEERRIAASADGQIIDLTKVQKKKVMTTSRPYPSSTPRFRKKTKPKKKKPRVDNLEERIRARMARSLRKTTLQRDNRMLIF